MKIVVLQDAVPVMPTPVWGLIEYLMEDLKLSDCNNFRLTLLFPTRKCSFSNVQEKKGTTEDELVGWHHRLDGHELEQALGVGDGQGSLTCCSRWDHKESDTNEQLNWYLFYTPYFKRLSQTFLWVFEGLLQRHGSTLACQRDAGTDSNSPSRCGGWRSSSWRRLPLAPL